MTLPVRGPRDSVPGGTEEMVYLLIAPIILVVVVVFGLAVLSGAIVVIVGAAAVSLVVTLLVFNPPVGFAVLVLAWIGAVLHRRNRRERRAGHRPIRAPAATGSSPKDREGRRRWGGSDGVCGRIPSRAPRLRLPLVWRRRLQRDIAVPQEIVTSHAGLEEALTEEPRQRFLLRPGGFHAGLAEPEPAVAAPLRALHAGLAALAEPVELGGEQRLGSAPGARVELL